MAAVTHAQSIAARFHEDGQCWTDDGGHRIEEVLLAQGATEERRGTDFLPLRRYALADGSAILTTPEWWDVEAMGRPWCCESVEGALGAMGADG